MIATPMRATWSRYWKLRSSPYSVLRSLQYERIAGVKLKGRTLDVGGGKKNSYYQLLAIDGLIESVNINPGMEPTHLADLNNPLPLASETFDNVFSLNTFEHIRNDEVAIREMMRVLKPGGAFHIMVPFLYRVHGSPCDYHRHTAYWWDEFFGAMSPKKCVIEPMLWDPFTSAQSLVEFELAFGLGSNRVSRFVARTIGNVRKSWFMLRAVLSHLRYRGHERLPEGAAPGYNDFALGYYIHGVK